MTFIGKKRSYSPKGLGVSSSFNKFEESDKRILIGLSEDCWGQNLRVLWFLECWLIQDCRSWMFYSLVSYVQLKEIKNNICSLVVRYKFLVSVTIICIKNTPCKFLLVEDLNIYDGMSLKTRLSASENDMHIKLARRRQQSRERSGE